MSLPTSQGASTRILEGDTRAQFHHEWQVPAQLGYSTWAFALDGFTVFAPSLQSTFQLSLAVLVSYRFCGNI